jgi:hypothetical protein
MNKGTRFDFAARCYNARETNCVPFVFPPFVFPRRKCYVAIQEEDFSADDAAREDFV